MVVDGRNFHRRRRHHRHHHRDLLPHPEQFRNVVGVVAGRHLFPGHREQDGRESFAILVEEGKEQNLRARAKLRKRRPGYVSEARDWL